MRSIQTVLILFAFATPALASDGVLEINQTCAASSAGCFAGDAGGFPVTVSQSGSYRLTGNVTVQTVNMTAILITSSDVTLDLNGFSIQGPVVCAGEPAFCSPSGSGRGIDASPTSRTTVRNGIVRGLGSDGLVLGDLSRVEGVRARSNGGNGISVGRLSQVSGITAESNGGYGVGTLAAGVLVERSTAAFNGNSGFSLGPNSNLRASTAFTNGLHGLDFNGPAGSATGAFEGNTFSGNEGSSVTSLAKATGGNLCNDGLCSVRGTSRFYLTQNSVNGANALTACVVGFHMGNIWELHDPSNFEYATPFGVVVADSGSGPPSAASGGADFGWMRTGFQAGSNLNCTNWTSVSASQFGGLFSLDMIFSTSTSPIAATAISPWLQPGTGSVRSCDKVHPVWCVED